MVLKKPWKQILFLVIYEPLFLAAMAHQLQVAPHELESAQKAIAQNLIINLPGGTDKIPIIAMVVDHFLCIAPLKKVMIAAPTR